MPPPNGDAVFFAPGSSAPSLSSSAPRLADDLPFPKPAKEGVDVDADGLEEDEDGWPKEKVIGAFGSCVAAGEEEDGVPKLKGAFFFSPPADAALSG